jgi:two-component sensor histidine kinase
MASPIPKLQREIGIGGATTFGALIALGLPIFLGMSPEHDLIGFVTEELTLQLVLMLAVFLLTAVIRSGIAKAVQVVILVVYGLTVLGQARPNSLTGLSIAGVGIILAAHYGFFEKQPGVKVATIVILMVGALIWQASQYAHLVTLRQAVFGFLYNAIAVIGLTVAYVLVLREAAASAASRQAFLEEAVESRTRQLTDEVAARRVAEEEARRTAERAEQLAAERLALIGEVHHRARNSLQMTLTLLEASTPESDNDFAYVVNQIRAIGLVYDLVDASEDLHAIDLDRYVEDLSRHLHMSHASPALEIQYESNQAMRTRLDPTVNLGLMLLELLRLIRAHAFENTEGALLISREATAETVRFELTHAGEPIPQEATPPSGEPRILGLLPALVQRLHADIQYSYGTSSRWLISIPRVVIATDGKQQA